MVNYTFKTILLGDTSIGKSTFLYKLRNHISKLDENIIIPDTIGVDFFSKNYSYKKKRRMDPVEIKINIWDISGRASFRSICNFYMKSVAGFFLFFNLHSPNWYESICSWLNLININKTCIHGCNHPIVLIGNKQINKKSLFKNQKLDELIKNYNIKFFEMNIQEAPVENINYIVEDLIMRIRNMKEENCKGIILHENSFINTTKEIIKDTTCDSNFNTNKCCNIF